MKINTKIYYIKEDKWENFLKIAESKFGFCEDTHIIYPKYIVRNCIMGKIRIGISEPCVNVWDGEDKNDSREVWLWHENSADGEKEYVKPYIKDLIDEGYIE